MQAVNKITHYNEWIAILFIIALFLLAILKAIKPNRLFGFTTAFFSPGFFVEQAEKNESFFNKFQLVFFAFMSIIFSIFIFTSTPNHLFVKNSTNYILVFIGITSYFLVRFFLDTFISHVLNIHVFLKYFLHAKLGYLKTLSLWLFPLLIINQYTVNNTVFIFSLFCVLMLLRLLLIIYNNKRLVLNKLFYFILYLCALEIAPLLILYKTTTK